MLLRLTYMLTQKPNKFLQNPDLAGYIWAVSYTHLDVYKRQESDKLRYYDFLNNQATCDDGLPCVTNHVGNDDP